jgi:hypothetical protein
MQLDINSPNVVFAAIAAFIFFVWIFSGKHDENERD